VLFLDVEILDNRWSECQTVNSVNRVKGVSISVLLFKGEGYHGSGGGFKDNITP